MWAVIRMANKVSVVIGTFEQYDTAQAWARANRGVGVRYKVVVFYRKAAYRRYRRYRR